MCGVALLCSMSALLTLRVLRTTSSGFLKPSAAMAGLCSAACETKVSDVRRPPPKRPRYRQVGAAENEYTIVAAAGLRPHEG